jgi:hypothetical protein
VCQVFMEPSWTECCTQYRQRLVPRAEQPPPTAPTQNTSTCINRPQPDSHTARFLEHTDHFFHLQYARSADQWLASCSYEQ